MSKQMGDLIEFFFAKKFLRKLLNAIYLGIVNLHFFLVMLSRRLSATLWMRVYNSGYGATIDSNAHFVNLYISQGSIAITVATRS